MQTLSTSLPSVLAELEATKKSIGTMSSYSFLVTDAVLLIVLLLFVSPLILFLFLLFIFSLVTFFIFFFLLFISITHTEGLSEQFAAVERLLDAHILEHNAQVTQQLKDRMHQFSMFYYYYYYYEYQKNHIMKFALKHFS